jgi:hypothetical protein
VEKGTLHNWYGALREAMMKAKEDKTMVVSLLLHNLYSRGST